MLLILCKRLIIQSALFIRKKTQKGKKDSKVKAEAEKIYRKYLQRGAVYEINLGPDVKRQIDKDIQGMAQK